jgi:6-phosphogluconolactonase (cycloisomerase 2 family)
MRLTPLLGGLAALGVAAALAPAAGAAPGPRGVVYSLTNQAPGNAVAVFDRAADGSLTPVASYLTGGLGSGAGLGSQGALAMSQGGRYLFAVNAGSSQISTFRVHGDHLQLLGVVGSGGTTPISLTTERGVLYALNAGGTGNISGFDIGSRGSLTPIAGSTRPLSSDAAGPAEVAFTPDGRTLVVTEKNTNVIDTYAVDGSGAAGPPSVHASAGAEPFGFAFDPRGDAIVSEAVGGAPGGTTISSYSTSPFATVTPSLASGQTAACWVAVTPNGRYAYAANTGSGNVTGLSVSRGGSLALLDPSGISATLAPGAHAIDEAISRGGRFLYVLDSAHGSVSGFAIAADGSLSPVGTAGGLPASDSGLLAR